jgi:hypothetical protein
MFARVCRHKVMNIPRTKHGPQNEYETISNKQSNLRRQRTKCLLDFSLSIMYDDMQTLFRLAMSFQLGASLSGSVDYIEDQTDLALKAELAHTAPDIGDWKLVWGPAVYSAPGSSIPDNAMFAAERSPRSGSRPWIVVRLRALILHPFLISFLKTFLSFRFNTGLAATPH